MISTNEPKVKEVVQNMHEALLRKAKKGGTVKEDFVIENRIFAVLCMGYDFGPTKVANLMREKYGCELTPDEVIQIFRNRRIGNPAERKELLLWADNVTKFFADAIRGNREAFEQYEKARKEPALRNGRRHESQERVAAIMIYEKYPEIDIYNDTDSLFSLGNTFARYYFYEISDAIREAYGFYQFKDNRNHFHTKDSDNKMTYEQALRRVEQLETTLERTNTMLQDLQDEFEEQLEVSKVTELADFFSKLNSEKYGCILDELLVVHRGMDTLRRNNYELPIEINGLMIMVKKLIQFVRDSHIEPIMKINSIREVIASDIEYCNYEGTPFTTPDEKKTVKVVSPGWVYKDKEIQISRPKIKEED